MTDLAPYQPPVPATADHESWMRVYEPMIDLAGRLANSPFVPDKMRGNPADTFSVLLAGHGLGLSPIQSLQSIVLISGKPYISTEVILGLAYRAGHQVQWLESGDKRATVRVIRGDGHGSAEVTYTMAQAQAAGLAGKDNWRRMPAEMLRARAVRAALKMVAPDIALGLETAESPAVAVVEAATGTAVVQVGGEQGGGTAERRPQPEPVAADPAPQPDTAPEPEEEPKATTAQLRKINAQLSDLERRSGEKWTREQRRDFIAELAELDGLTTAKDLTKEQAHTVIERIEPLLTVPDVVEGEVVEDEQ